MSKLPNHFIWDDVSKNKFRETLKSAQIQKKLHEFVKSDFTNDFERSKQMRTGILKHFTRNIQKEFENKKDQKQKKNHEYSSKEMV